MWMWSTLKSWFAQLTSTNFSVESATSRISGSITIEKPKITVTLSDEDKNIRKITVGDVRVTHRGDHGKVLMLLGATGSGKSTLINGFVNYVKQVEYKDPYRYELISDETSDSQAKSQTKWITAYTFSKKDSSLNLPYTLTIIDTPGYGDTRGLERDKEITKQIKEFFSIKGPQGLDHIDGIGFVVQAPLARLTPTQKYIFKSILSIFGKDIFQNIFLMITFADGSTPPVLSAIDEESIEFKKACKFNNSAHFPDEGGSNVAGNEYQCNAFNEMFWEMGKKSFENFLQILGQTESVSLQLTREVLQEREHLECLIEDLQQKIRIGLFKVDQLHQEELVLIRHVKEIETNKDFDYWIEETRQKKVDLKHGEHVTNCLFCHSTCHYPCRIPKDEDKMNCAAMVDHDHCKVCPNKCSWNMHFNNGYRFKLYTENVKKTSRELKKRYEVAKEKKSEKERIMSGLSTELEVMHYGVFFNIRKVRASLERLGAIALRPNPLSDVDYIDLLIRSEEMEAKEGWTNRVKAYTEVRRQVNVVSTVRNTEELLKKFKGAPVKQLSSWNYLKEALK
ncbi:uncharacterized protein LOC110235649 [Exaiptasia diaphana]|uniref:Septin-type G domain-containing protein n=1 Tax=Exaiptasia diaphana TaxID=2652724 RepID=A0A913X013_EXADI|nr:uncharacterized protein LOC110235649 [Exaiptasia diaphana]KXJ30015.1 hypothetical protein AC249_AIPGENE3065 [Exaiptasia diaphana]